MATATRPKPEAEPEVVEQEELEPEAEETSTSSSMPVQIMQQPAPVADTFAIAALSDEQFDNQLAMMKRSRDRIQTMKESIMVLGEDYGVIPGTEKPSLLKPGAEKLAQAYRLAAEIKVWDRIGDGVAEPGIRYDAECLLHYGSFEGPVVGTGHGTAHSFEKRYRRTQRECPVCGKPAIIKSKAEYGGGWYCWPKNGGCDSRFPDGDERIESQTSEKVGDLPSQVDLANTILKMAEKRAFIDAVLRTTASSGLFTQDVEDSAPAAQSQTTQNAQPTQVARVTPTKPAQGDGGVLAATGMCPTHNKAFRIGNKGNRYCATKVGEQPDGSNIWCDEGYAYDQAHGRYNAAATPPVTAAEVAAAPAAAPVSSDQPPEFPPPSYEGEYVDADDIPF